MICEVEQKPKAIETEGPTTEYVLGFMTYESCGTEHVLLIKKKRPEWQEGLLNGVGGHIEPGETPTDAMVREFHKETGLFAGNWRKFCIMFGKQWIVHCFTCYYGAQTPKFFSMTDEIVMPVTMKKAISGNLASVKNIPWLLKMIKSQKIDGVKFYSVEYVQ